MLAPGLFVVVAGLLFRTPVRTARLLATEVNNIDEGTIDRSDVSRLRVHTHGHCSKDTRDLHAKQQYDCRMSRPSRRHLPITRLNSIDQIIVRDDGDRHGRLTRWHLL